ncbi:hypothetical protein VTI28DRAFT_5121 [Corynascus sepedonium]
MNGSNIPKALSGTDSTRQPSFSFKSALRKISRSKQVAAGPPNQERADGMYPTISQSAEFSKDAAKDGQYISQNSTESCMSKHNLDGTVIQERTRAGRPQAKFGRQDFSLNSHQPREYTNSLSKALGEVYKTTATAATPVLTSDSAQAHDITYSKSLHSRTHHSSESTSTDTSINMSWGRRAAAAALIFERWRSGKGRVPSSVLSSSTTKLPSYTMEVKGSPEINSFGKGIKRGTLPNTVKIEGETRHAVMTRNGPTGYVRGE